LRLAPLVLGAVPTLGEFRRAGFDVVPIEAHGLSQTADALAILKCAGSSRRAKSLGGSKILARPKRRPEPCYFGSDRCKRVTWPN
jgi:hypothetical protein